jgi:hypothetical protein
MTKEQGNQVTTQLSRAFVYFLLGLLFDPEM